MINEKIDPTRQQLIVDDKSSIPRSLHRLIDLDPTEIFGRIESLNRKTNSRFKRYNPIWSTDIFPDRNDGTCSCGCGKQLSGRRKRYATEECAQLLSQTIAILSGKSDFIRKVMQYMVGERCSVCGITDKEYPREDKWPTRENRSIEEYLKLCTKAEHEMSNKIHLDHIVPVHKGGSLCWLSNYQFLCESCHKIKSRNERK